MSDPLDIINEVYERIVPKEKKEWYVSKYATYNEDGTPGAMWNNKEELWVRPDIWKSFISNTWIDKNKKKRKTKRKAISS